MKSLFGIMCMLAIVLPVEASDSSSDLAVENVWVETIAGLVSPVQTFGHATIRNVGNAPTQTTYLMEFLACADTPPPRACVRISMYGNEEPLQPNQTTEFSTVWFTTGAVGDIRFCAMAHHLTNGDPDWSNNVGVLPIGVPIRGLGYGFIAPNQLQTHATANNQC